MKKPNTFDVSKLILIHDQTVSEMQDIKILLKAVRNELDVALDYIKEMRPSIDLCVFDDLKIALKLAIVENGSNTDYHINEAITLRYSIEQVGEGDSND